MPSIKLQKPEELSAAERRSYSTILNVKAVAHVLQGRNPLGIQDSDLFLLGAFEGEELCGCAVFSTQAVIYCADLHYFVVTDPWRGKGIAGQLLDELKGILQKTNIHVCWAKYTLEDPLRNVIEHLLQKRDWSSPYQEFIRFIFDGPLFDPPWLQKKFSLPQGCELFRWNELTNSEREALKKQETELTFHSNVSPFSTRYAIEPSNSLGIRSKSGVIGWLITHRPNKETIRYSAIYVSSEMRFTSCALALLTESIRIQKNLPIRWAIFDVNMHQVSANWRRFVLQKLQPYAQTIETHVVCTLKVKNI